MQPIIPADETAFPLHPPKDWDSSKGTCETLHVVPIEFCGQTSLASLWKPSPQELALIAKGHPIVFISCGTTHPPVALAVAQNKDRITD